MSSSDSPDPGAHQRPVENSDQVADFALDSNGQESVNGNMTTTPYTTSPLTAADPFAALTQSFTPKRAVSYLRVSTREQAERGGREEGFSIPAQRDANKKKAQAVGAMVVKEFVEKVKARAIGAEVTPAVIGYVPRGRRGPRCRDPAGRRPSRRAHSPVRRTAVGRSGTAPDDAR